jgi:hypothetical protein
VSRAEDVAVGEAARDGDQVLRMLRAFGRHVAVDGGREERVAVGEHAPRVPLALVPASVLREAARDRVELGVGEPPSHRQ